VTSRVLVGLVRKVIVVKAKKSTSRLRKEGTSRLSKVEPLKLGG
jgi:hypothetical protein